MSKKNLADQIDLLTNQPQLQFFLEGVGVEGGFCWVTIFVVVTKVYVEPQKTPVIRCIYLFYQRSVLSTVPHYRID